MIRLTLLLLAGIAVVMVVAGRGPVAPPDDPARRHPEVARAGSAPTELLPQPNRLDLADEEGAVARALAAGGAPRETVPPAEPEAEAGPNDAIATRSVKGDRVNMRSGPGTTFDVVGRLQKGDRVEFLEEPGDGWVKLRVMQTGQTGWVADFLLADG